MAETVAPESGGGGDEAIAARLELAGGTKLPLSSEAACRTRPVFSLVTLTERAGSGAWLRL